MDKLRLSYHNFNMLENVFLHVPVTYKCFLVLLCSTEPDERNFTRIAISYLKWYKACALNFLIRLTLKIQFIIQINLQAFRNTVKEIIKFPFSESLWCAGVIFGGLQRPIQRYIWCHSPPAGLCFFSLLNFGISYLV